MLAVAKSRNVEKNGYQKRQKAFDILELSRLKLCERIMIINE